MSASATIESRGVVVLKLGGSVLTDLDAYRDCAAFLAGRLARESESRFVVVVSAQYGETDALLRLAGGLCPEPAPEVLDLLWSTGETRSAAMLALALLGAGVSAIGLSVYETGLRVAREDTTGHVALDATVVRDRLRNHDVVVVPGFLACAADGGVVSLGRGGSDLTAVVLAAGLAAERCELVKDVPGYFTDDPRYHGHAVQIASLTYGDALRMAAEGCALVQAVALEEAARARVPLLVRSLDDRAPHSWVHDGRKRAAG